MRYTAKDLQKVSKTSLQSINKLFKSNSELKELAKEHRIVENRSVFYDEIIYEWFCRRYEKENQVSVLNSVVGGNIQNEDTEIPQDTAPIYARQNEALIAEINDLKMKNAELQAKLETIEAERKQLFEANGNLLLMLSQERALTQKYLPPPRKTFGEKLRSIFHKEN